MKIIFTMSVYASVMIFIIMLFRFFLIKRLPKKMFKILWLLAAVRMLLPVFIPFRTDLFSGSGGDILAERFSVNEQIISPPEEFTAAPVTESPPKYDFVFIIWLTGAVFVSVFFTVSYIRGLQKFRRSVPMENTEMTEIINRFKLLRKVRISVSNKTETFLTYGTVRPRIICPSCCEKYDVQKNTFAVCHELIHIKNFDSLYKIIIAASVCVHWFNPFAWVMLIFASRDTELSCDEELLKMFPESRAEYALTLIDFKEKQNSNAIFNAFGKNAVKERIEMIMKFRKSTVLSAVASAAVVLCTAAAFAFSAEASDTDALTFTDDYGNSFVIDRDEVMVVVYDENGNVVLADRHKHKSDIPAYAEKSSEKITYNSTDTGKKLYTADGTEIAIPPKASYGVMRHISEDEYLNGESAANFLKAYFDGDADFTYPLDTKYNSSYEYKGGFTVPAQKGETVYSMLGGTVAYAGFSFPFGKALIIEHNNGDFFLYAHCDDICVNEGDEVQSGDVIGHVGSTGDAADNELYIYKY